MNSFTHVPETWAVAIESQRETQEMEGDSKGKDQDGVRNKMAEQSSEREDDGHVGSVDPKDVITTSIEEDNGCEAHEIEEATWKDDIKEVVMDDMTKAIEQRHMQSMLVPETWAVATESQRETQQTEGGDKGKLTVGVHDQNGEQSMTKDDEGRVGQEDLKSVPWEEISTSNNEDTSIKIVISNMRLYDEGARSEKHEMWLLKDLKKGLLWVVDIGIQTGLYEGKYGKRK